MRKLLSYGISDGIRLATYDAVQSLLAVATLDSKIYIFKDKNIKVQYSLPKRIPILHLVLHGCYLIAIDSRNNLYSWSIDTASITPSVIYSIRGYVTCVETDPCIDWLYIGLKDGTVDVWDIDRECISPYKIANLYTARHEKWREMNYNYAPSKSYLSPVICIRIHPRDVGTLLIGYPDGAVLYSIKKNAPVFFFELEIPQRIYETNSVGKVVVSRPKLTSFSWAPHGYHLVTSYQNGCFAFWSAKSDQRPLQVRTLDETEVDILLEDRLKNDSHSSVYARNPIFSILWSCNDDLENTSIFVVGGNINNEDSKELSILDFGQSPSCSSSVNVFSQYYTAPKQHHVLSHFLSSNVVDICVFSKISQSYFGNYNTELIMLILASGEVELLKYPDGIFLNSLKSLPASLEWMSPRIRDLSLCCMSNNAFLSGNERQQKILSYNEVIATGHDNGIVRLYNVTRDHKLEKMHEIFLGKVLNNSSDMIKVTITNLSEASELIVGCEKGELIIYNSFSFDKKKTFESDNFSQASKEFAKYTIENSKSNSYMDDRSIVSLNNKIEDNSSQVSVFQIHRGSVISVKTSNIGLVACGYEFGTVILINTHKQAIIFQIELSEVKSEKKKFSKKTKDFENDENYELEVALIFEFTIGKFKTNGEPAILFMIGTSTGRLIFYSIYFMSKNEFNIKYLGEFLFENDSIINILSIHRNTLKPYIIYPNIFKDLKSNSVLENLILVVTKNSLKMFDSCFVEISRYLYGKSIQCVSANNIYREEIDPAVACVLNDKRVLLISLSNLSLITSINLPSSFSDKLNKSIVTLAANIYLWVNETELSLFYLLGNGVRINEFSSGVLYDDLKKVPQRPTISTWEWIIGTNYITIAELDLLIGGSNRPLPKKLLNSLAEQKLKDRTKKKAAPVDEQNSFQSSGTLFTQTTENIRERGKKIFGIEEKLNSLESSSMSLLKSIQDYAGQQKNAIRKQALKSTIKSFFR
ncbi:uncharacterized protein T551_01323 [Pneumocystis jirovecii RU7]|uniref:Lethal giant larvae (Lgl)-like C-terminal domain-containing protein n=1 Tax=Pneumocystis jirovecii (strain RU7) TaxID=1408657 RepID=A0A0W4ZSB3_PNEJ7|nr:uncharacterized protein T551_01323 [Pneumocystis jirovecii RU7]KTW31251.1 hypothetical protein T551_01323 [Pneumocystis jirovecii RU7]